MRRHWREKQEEDENPFKDVAETENDLRSCPVGLQSSVCDVMLKDQDRSRLSKTSVTLVISGLFLGSHETSFLCSHRAQECFLCFSCTSWI